MKRLFAFVAVVCGVGFAAWPNPGRAAAGSPSLTIDQLIDIRHPSNPSWSADGRESRLASADARVGGIAWSPDSAYVLYAAGGGPIRHEQTPAYSGVKIVYTITENAQGKAYAVPAAGGAAVALPAGGFGARR